jgi:hypothetical protein
MTLVRVLIGVQDGMPQPVGAFQTLGLAFQVQDKVKHNFDFTRVWSLPIAATLDEWREYDEGVYETEGD